MQKLPKLKSDLDRAARRVFNDTRPIDTIRHALGIKVTGPLMDQAIARFASGECDLRWLREFFKSNGEVRLKMLAREVATA